MTLSEAGPRARALFVWRAHTHIYASPWRAGPSAVGGGAPNGFHQLLTNFACEKLQQEYLLDMCVQDHGLLPARTCMVGDRLDTDVLFGQRGGLHTLLVLSGATTREQLESDGNAVTPSFVAQSIAALTAAAEAKAVTAKL